MEDRRILEEFEMFCEDMYCFVDDDMGGHFKAVIGDQKANTMLGYLRFKKILENLINRNKELEEKWDRDCHKIHEMVNAEYKIETDYIPKSKVKEKIKYIGKLYAEDEIDCEWYSEMKQVLQELLEE